MQYELVSPPTCLSELRGPNVPGNLGQESILWVALRNCKFHGQVAAKINYTKICWQDMEEQNVTPRLAPNLPPWIIPLVLLCSFFVLLLLRPPWAGMNIAANAVTQRPLENWKLRIFARIMSSNKLIDVYFQSRFVFDVADRTTAQCQHDFANCTSWI